MYTGAASDSMADSLASRHGGPIFPTSRAWPGAGRTRMPRERTARSYGDEPAGLESSGGRWLTIQEACAVLGVDQSTLRRWSDTGKVPVFRTPGGHRRYAIADVNALASGGAFVRTPPQIRKSIVVWDGAWSTWPSGTPPFQLPPATARPSLTKRV